MSVYETNSKDNPLIKKYQNPLGIIGMFLSLWFATIACDLQYSMGNITYGEELRFIGERGSAYIWNLHTLPHLQYEVLLQSEQPSDSFMQVNPADVVRLSDTHLIVEGQQLTMTIRVDVFGVPYGGQEFTLSVNEVENAPNNPLTLPTSTNETDTNPQFQVTTIIPTPPTRTSTPEP